jgi:hypothetical protein
LIGYARDAAANVLPDRVTQLRELSRGTVVGYARTNERGQFAYHDLPPGTYIVELLAPAGNVLAVSDALTIASGEIVLTVVQLTASTRSFASWISGATTSAVNTAVQAGVLALESAPAVSPES